MMKLLTTALLLAISGSVFAEQYICHFKWEKTDNKLMNIIDVQDNTATTKPKTILAILNTRL